MVQVVGRRPLTAETRVRARVGSCGICGGQSGTGTGFLEVLRFTLVSLFHRGSPYSLSSGGRLQDMLVAAFLRHHLTPSTGSPALHAIKMCLLFITQYKQ
jgi:hypothetical protein